MTSPAILSRVFAFAEAGHGRACALLLVVGLVALVLTIIAGIKANEGTAYRYPFTLRLIK